MKVVVIIGHVVWLEIYAEGLEGEGDRIVTLFLVIKLRADTFNELEQCHNVRRGLTGLETGCAFKLGLYVKDELSEQATKERYCITNQQ